ncbi:MAG: ATP-binding cassette domain-containing protein [Spirochaetes bacterium]|uniref:ATP-binding cassette domain-containing protein n=1 Tax=Candidatus Aphodenecus pullistercoris TaxID=2840669 RepID=A0A9D9HAB7_9SPIR|nr:ATP-binding cassette domain-containing protein [Candidatus Aphodenecus pullistercoris]
MLEVDRLCVDVGGRRLLDEVSFRLEEGRIYALIGANGSGKTSLIRALTSYYPRYGGSIRFDGKELRDCRRKERESLHALLPQVLPQLDSTLDTMLSGGSPILGQLGLEKLALRRISSLSGGERELSFLAMMLSREARLYCLDEAEANLDARCRRLVENAMRSLMAEGKMVLASFHDLDRAMRLSDGLLVMDAGRLVFAGDGASFASSGLAERLFGLSRRRFTSAEGELVELFVEVAGEDPGEV